MRSRRRCAGASRRRGPRSVARETGHLVTPDARVQAAIEVIDTWQGGGEGLDRVLTRWGRTHRFAGSADRHAIADLVYDAVRRLRSSAWVAGADGAATGRDAIRGSLIQDGIDPDTVFGAGQYGPSSLSEAESSVSRRLADAPRAVRLDYPDWLNSDLSGLPEGILALQVRRAPLFLRANLLKTDRAAAAAALREDGIETADVRAVPTALKVTSNPRAVRRSRAYLDGLVEVQDAASQAVADLAAARPGETVLDLCAGGGGKTLALAAAMKNEGRLLAYDNDPERLADLPARAARAGASVTVLSKPDLHALRGICDVVLVDAPCSGSGVWRRNPDAKWRLTKTDLQRYCTTQEQLLDQATEFARPGGRLLYATCSLFARENERQVEEFLERHSGWYAASVRRFLPGDDGDGLFAADLCSAPGVAKD